MMLSDLEGGLGYSYFGSLLEPAFAQISPVTPGKSRDLFGLRYLGEDKILTP